MARAIRSEDPSLQFRHRTGQLDERQLDPMFATEVEKTRWKSCRNGAVESEREDHTLDPFVRRAREQLEPQAFAKLDECGRAEFEEGFEQVHRQMVMKEPVPRPGG